MLSISQKQISPPMLPRSAYQGIEREELEPELVGVKSRKRGGGWERTCSYGSKKGMINSLIVGNFHSSIFEICLSRSITICSSNGPLWSLYWSDSYCAPCERVWIREGNRSDVLLTQPGKGLEGIAAWGMSASRRKAHFDLWVIGRFIWSRAGAQGSWYYPGAKNPGGDCNEQKSHSPA